MTPILRPTRLNPAATSPRSSGTVGEHRREPARKMKTSAASEKPKLRNVKREDVVGHVVDEDEGEGQLAESTRGGRAQ